MVGGISSTIARNVIATLAADETVTTRAFNRDMITLLKSFTAACVTATLCAARATTAAHAYKDVATSARMRDEPWNGCALCSC